MCTNTERLLYNLPTLVTLLRGETRVDSYHLVPSIPSFGTQDIEKRAPASIHNALCKMMVFHHVVDLQILNNNCLVCIGILLCRFEMEVFSLTLNFQMCLSGILTRFTSSVTSLLASAYGSLFPSECGLTLAVHS